MIVSYVWSSRAHVDFSCALCVLYEVNIATWKYYYCFKYVVWAILHAVEALEIRSVAQYCRRRCNLIWAPPPLFVVLCPVMSSSCLWRRVWRWRINQQRVFRTFITRRSFMNPNSFTSIIDTTKLAISFGNKNDISKFQKVFDAIQQ